MKSPPPEPGIGADLAYDVLAELSRKGPPISPGRKPKYSEAEYLYVRSIIRKRRKLQRQLAILPNEEQLATKLRVQVSTIQRIATGRVSTYAHLDPEPIP